MRPLARDEQLELHRPQPALAARCLGEVDERAADAHAALIGSGDQHPELARRRRRRRARGCCPRCPSAGWRPRSRARRISSAISAAVVRVAPVAPEPALGGRVDVVDEVGQLLDEPGIVGSRRLQQADVEAGRRGSSLMTSRMASADRAAQYIVLTRAIVIYDRSRGAPAAAMRGGGGPPPALHARRGGAARRPVGALAPDPPARARARHAALRAHQPPRHRRPRPGRRSPRAPAASWPRSTARAPRSTSCAACCAAASGSARCCPPATSTSPGCSRASATPTRASRSACARASPPTCCACSPPTSSTPPSACWPASPRRARRRAARPRRGGRRLRPGPRPAASDVTVADLAAAAIIAPAPGSAITAALERAVRRGRRAAPPHARERRPVPAALAGRPRLRHGDPAPLADRARGPGRRGAQPAARRPAARGPRLAPRAQRPTRGTRVHRLRPPRTGHVR